ncbi:MAG: hypothetical protein ACRDK7_07575 [Solirubrobacteraceae bacterium]
MRQAARRTSLLTLLGVALLVGIWASAAHAAGIGLAEWEAGTCNGSEAEVAVKANCSYASNPSKFYTQAAGHPPWGLTGFKLAETSPGSGIPAGQPLKRIRVDVPPGLAADPQVLNTCPKATFEASPKSCPADSKAGFVELKAYVELPVVPQTLTLKGNVYNLPQETDHPLLFGIDVEGVPPLVGDTLLLLEGHVSYAQEAVETSELRTADFHEWFEINNIPTTIKVKAGLLEPEVGLRTLESKLFFNGHAGKLGSGKENFLTMPSSCSAPTTSFLELETYGPPTEKLTGVPTTPPVGVSGCNKVPFEPTATVTPETSRYDSPDGSTTNVHVSQLEKSNEINTADIDDAHVTLPEGLTLNPSAAQGLQACTQSQLHRGSSAPVECPAASKIGTVNIETDLPPGSLAGNVYLGKANGTSVITGPPYLIFIDTESVYNVSVRLEGQVVPNPVTGRLEVSFLGNPQLPFSDLTLTLNGGPRAPLANPLSCAAANTSFVFSAYTGEGFGGSTPFAVDGCPASIPFVLTQSTQSANSTAGAYSPYTFNLARGDGQQYLSRISTTLPAGLLGAIPSVALCGEPQAAAGTCSAASQIGVASVTAGAGPEPYPLSGPVYLTGPYDGAPYGLSIPVSVVAGPFNLGTVTTRATIKVDPHTARVTVATTNLPTIVGGVPVRLKTLHVDVNRPSFIFNPTNCSPLATESTLTSTFRATQSLASAFQVGNCSALAFKPTFKVSTSARTSKKNGASLKVSLTQPAHQANIKSVYVSLPKQLPSRLTTLQKACPEATFAANPVNCRSLGSEVGSAVVTTPVLPGRLKGSAYLVSHGGEAFPDLDIVLEGDGVTVILTGNTKITKGITSSTFAAIPDVPVSSFVLTLPVGPHSALTANGNLCAKALTLPTTIAAQSGARLTQKTRLAVGNCPVQIVSHKVRGHKLVLRVKTFSAGRVSLKGRDLKAPRYKKLAKAKTATFTIALSRKGRAALARHRHRKLKIKVRVGFVPKAKASPVSAASVEIKFK